MKRSRSGTFAWPFALGRRAIAAVEFALILPVLLVLFIGTVEILTLYRTESKLNALTYNVSQMISLSPTPLTRSKINDICTGVTDGLQPFPPNGLSLAIASVTMETATAPASGGNPATTASYDEWEADVPSNCVGTAGSQIGATAAIAALAPAPGTGAVISPCDNGIIVKATLTYPGLLGLFITHAVTLSQTAYARWRYTTAMTELSCTDCSVNNTATQICKS